jgi:hypothetical protein
MHSDPAFHHPFAVELDDEPAPLLILKEENVDA